jgi:DNA-binding NarL/FixJ family response regulator
MEEKPLRIAFIEDDPIYLRMLKEHLYFLPWVQIVFSVNSIKIFWEKHRSKADLDILFIDIFLPEESGLEALPKIRKKLPNTQLIILTQHEDYHFLWKAIFNGADGYLLKDFPMSKMPGFLKIVKAGGALISPSMSKVLLQHFRSPTPEPLNEILRPKEIRLLQLFAEGYSYEEAAQMLGISVDGVRYYVKRIYKSLQVKNKTDAVQRFRDYLDAQQPPNRIGDPNRPEDDP